MHAILRDTTTFFHMDNRKNNINPFPHTTNQQQMTLKACRQYPSKFLQMKVKLLQKVENIVANEELLVLSNFPFCHTVFKRCLLQRPHKVSKYEKGFKYT